MTRVTAYLLQTFNDSKRKGVKPSPPVASKSADVARRTAERLSLTHLGVIAFSIEALGRARHYETIGLVPHKVELKASSRMEETGNGQRREKR